MVVSGWEVAGDYIYTVPGEQDSDFLVLTLSVPGYRLGPAHNHAYTHTCTRTCTQTHTHTSNHAHKQKNRDRSYVSRCALVGFL